MKTQTSRKEVRRLRKMLRAVVGAMHYAPDCDCCACKATREVSGWRRRDMNAGTRVKIKQLGKGWNRFYAQLLSGKMGEVERSSEHHGYFEEPMALVKFDPPLVNDEGRLVTGFWFQCDELEQID